MYATIVISTRNRPQKVVKTVQSILKNHYSNFEIIVVDQSTDDLTETALLPFTGNPRFRLIRTNETGLSHGRNTGIHRACGEYIVCTDDDCEVPSNWLQELDTAFSIDHRIAIVYGNVLPIHHDSHIGFIPGYIRETPFLAKNLKQKLEIDGIGACFGIKRNAWQRLHGFDGMLGTGAPLKAGEETDMTVRALLADYYVYETPAFFVTHNGFRKHAQGRELIRGYWYGTGAMFAKNFKCTPLAISSLLWSLLWRWVFTIPRVVQNMGGRPHRILRLVSFVHGFFMGLAIPVDCTKGHFTNWKNAHRL